ncbi:amino acid ABC transporter substrate-binding protein [Paraglaciecola hydrolytica]|uniref:Amino acid ABC transporter substrate-binding protein n=2 Tax=Paraglaciecola hydrolytica TaxID=1799789 RepID=A0A136A0J6_9ALTE|nr:amino acid ABC transporter substrate-binding protein [Paraglaciecola hydrolytica]
MSENDKGSEYPLKLLALALDQTGVNYRLIASDRIMPQSKALKRLMDNREVNVVWSMTDEQREEVLLPVRIPIYKGLIGWRIFLIRKDMDSRFKYIQSLEHLLKLNPIQGSDWPDTRIMQANGFDVLTASDHDALFGMLVSAQGDFFPRSIVEIWDELENNNSRNNLEIENKLGVRYPAAMYYFVNKKSVPLANLIQTGLEMAIKNGKFDELFLQVHQPYIDASDLKNRTFYQLQNSYLPIKTPLHRKELWFENKQPIVNTEEPES